MWQGIHLARYIYNTTRDNKMEISKEQFKALLDNINWEIANTIDENDLRRILDKSCVQLPAAVRLKRFAMESRDN